MAIPRSNPRPANCLKLTAEEGYRLRSGNYRILHRIDDKNKIIGAKRSSFKKSK